MAITLSQLRARAEALSDQPASTTTTFVTAVQFNTFVNDGIRALYDEVVKVHPDFRVTPQTAFTITNTANNFNALPADFRSVRAVIADPTTTARDPLPKYSLRTGMLEWNRRSYRLQGSNVYIEPRDNSAGTYQLLYVPTAPVLALDADALDTELEQHQDVIVLHAAMMAATKNEWTDMFTTLGAQFAQAMDRAKDWANSQRSADPDTVEDVRTPSRRWYR